MNQAATITQILVPTDFSPASQVACHLAARLARYLKAGLVIFHAIPRAELLRDLGRPVKRTQVQFLHAVRARLESWFEESVPLELRQFLPVGFRVKPGEPIPEIAWAVGRSGADLILMATQGRTGFAHLLMGSVTEAVLRSVPVPVLALRPGQGACPLTEVQRILWATDLSPVSERAWGYVVTLASAFAAQVVLLHAVRPAERAAGAGHSGAPHADCVEHRLTPLEEELERRQHVLATLGLHARRKVVVGVPTEVIVAEAGEEQADLIVVGTHGRTGFPHALVGSVAEAVIRRAPCPVLAVKVGRDSRAKARGSDGIAA